MLEDNSILYLKAGGNLSKSIAVIGAGAKAAALVARAATLKALERKNVPQITVFESAHVGAAWSGLSDFTSGHLLLCTPGEKDVGFPYDETSALFGKAPIARELFSRFSWSAFQVATGRFAEWVDRDRLFPTHSGWADYLEWVFEQADANVIRAHVNRIVSDSDKWEVHFQRRGPKKLSFDGVVLTGTGQAKRVSVEPGTPASNIFDAQTFWSSRKRFKALPKGARVVVVGDGGAAGTIVAWLAEQCRERPEVGIVSISPMGTLFPRGDGYAERRWFTDPSDWAGLDVQDRRKLMERTEAGVISLRLKDTIDRSRNVTFHRGRAEKVRVHNHALAVETSYGGTTDYVPATFVINAIGFNVWSLLNLVDDPAVAALAKDSRRAKIEEEMLGDLSMPPSFDFPPRLHVPGLAGLANGPGMGNLGCLGLVASSILRSY